MLYEVLGKGHRVTENGVERLVPPGGIIELPERAAAPLVPWRLKPRPDLDVEGYQAAGSAETAVVNDGGSATADTVDVGDSTYAEGTAPEAGAPPAAKARKKAARGDAE